MKVRVDLYKESGKWYAGDVIDIDETIPMWDARYAQELVNSQNFVVDGAFDEFYVVVSGVDENGPFRQALYPIGRFAGLRKRSV